MKSFFSFFSRLRSVSKIKCVVDDDDDDDEAIAATTALDNYYQKYPKRSIFDEFATFPLFMKSKRERARAFKPTKTIIIILYFVFRFH